MSYIVTYIFPFLDAPLNDFAKAVDQIRIDVENTKDQEQKHEESRANHALGIGVLPRRSWRNDRLPDIQHPGLMRKSFAIDLVPVPDNGVFGTLKWTTRRRW